MSSRQGGVAPVQFARRGVNPWAHLALGVAITACLFVCSRLCSGRRRRRRTPFIFQDYEEARKNPGRLPSGIAHAAAGGDTRALQAWIESSGKGCLDARTSQGRTALHYAATEGQNGCIRILLDAGADVHALDNAGQTALHLVATHGHGTCVKILLDAGADPTLTDGHGFSAIALAERGGRVGSVRLMRLHVSQSRSIYSEQPLSPTGARHR